MTTRSTRQVERLFTILNLLGEREAITARELASYCGTSIRSIYRDMQLLESVGVMYISEGKAGYRLIQKPVQPHRLFSKEEWLALTTYPFLLGRGMSKQEHGIQGAYRNGLEKLKELTRNETNEKLAQLSEELGDRIRIHDQIENGYSNIVMPVLLRSILENRALEISYYAIYRDELSQRTIYPYYLLPRSGHLYVIAKCLLRDDVRIFRLDRIKEADLMKSTFSLQEDFDINDYLSNRWSIFAEDDLPTTFVVRFDSNAARYVKELHFYAETELIEQEDNSIILKAIVQSRKEFIRWVRAFGLRAEVIEPASTRDQLLEEYHEQIKKYKNSTEVFNR